MADQQRKLQNSELQFDKFTTRFHVGKVRFKTQVSAWSGSPSKAMLWIKEVEMVDSLDEIKSWRSIAGNNFPNFEMLDASIG